MLTQRQCPGKGVGVNNWDHHYREWGKGTRGPGQEMQGIAGILAHTSDHLPPPPQPVCR